MRVVFFHKAFVVFFISAFFFVSKIFAQTTFYANCPVKKIGKNEYVQIQFTVENARQVDQINPPVFKNFSIVSGPVKQTGITSINGNVKRTISLQYLLQPLKAGKLSIGPGSAIADGKKFYSEPITIEVENKSGSNQQPQNPYSPFSNFTMDELTTPSTTEFDDYILRKGDNVEEKIKKNLFVRAEVSKRSCYVGEPIVVTYKLYSRLKSESNLTKAPSLNGFSVIELGQRTTYTLTTEKYNGRDYNVYILRKAQLYPLQSGILTLDAAVVDNKVTFVKQGAADIRNRNDLYDMMRNFANDYVSPEDLIEKNITLKNDPVTINVLPLPEQNKPAGFKGAVGNFTIDAHVDKTSFTADDAVNLIVTITGAGNMPMINSPKISWPANVEGFEPEAADTIDQMSVPLKGTKTYTYPFIVSGAGTIIISPVEFSFFDSNTKMYKTVSSQPISLNVEKGTGRINERSANKKTESVSKNIADSKWIIAGGAALLLGLIFWFIKNDKQQRIVNAHTLLPEKITVKEEVSKHPLEGVSEWLAQNNALQFYTQLNKCLKEFIANRLNISVDDVKIKRLGEMLDKKNVPVTTTLLTTDLLQQIEMNLYAPMVADTEMQQDYERANEVVGLLEKQIA